MVSDTVQAMRIPADPNGRYSVILVGVMGTIYKDLDSECKQSVKEVHVNVFISSRG